MPSFRPWLALAGLGLAVAAPAQTTIQLDSVIGVAGTNAASVSGVGNEVNFTGYALNSGVTTLTASGSAGSSAFDFVNGFSDLQSRTTGSSAGAGNVFADLKYDSSSTGPLLLDTNNDGLFTDESAQPGFGIHGDTFITFDLDVIRTNRALTAGTPFTLSGSAGVANFSGWGKNSAAIIVDGTQRAVFDWTEGTADFSSFALTLSGSDRYVTFVGLSGLDSSNWGAHLGFANVTLQAVPEPSASLLLAIGVAATWSLRRRRA